jgi:eukaryotic-like serine/threonine-protein kinase
VTEMSPAETVFFAALALEDPARRAAYLDEACGTDAGLRRRVEQLLAAHPQVGSLLQEESAADRSPAGNGGAEVTTDVPIPEGPGTAIGPRHHKWREGNEYIAVDSRPLVIRRS